MKTLIIYDSTGTEIFIQGGFPYEPVGEIKSIITDIPENKRIKGIDITAGRPILEDIPKTEVDILKEKVESLEKANAELTTLVSIKSQNA